MVALSEKETGALVATVSVSSGTELSGASELCLLSDFSAEVTCGALLSATDVTCESVLSTAEISDDFFVEHAVSAILQNTAATVISLIIFVVILLLLFIIWGSLLFLITVYHINYRMSSLNSIRYDALFKKIKIIRKHSKNSVLFFGGN